MCFSLSKFDPLRLRAQMINCASLKWGLSFGFMGSNQLYLGVAMVLIGVLEEGCGIVVVSSGLTC